MQSTTFFASLAASLTWAAPIVNFIVIPFFFRREKIFTDLVHSGAIANAKSAIEVEEIVPALAGLAQAAVETRDAWVSKGLKADYKAMLDEVDFVPFLKRAQDAMDKQRNIQSFLDVLCHSSGKLWKVGIAHALSVIAIPMIMFFVEHEMARTVGVTTAVILAIVFGFSVVWYAFKYDRWNKKLYTALGLS